MPAIVNVTLGKNESWFTLSADANIIAARYIVDFVKIDSTGARLYSNHPSLDVIVKENLCEIKSRYNLIEVVHFGLGIPIIFDFENCIP
jgi:hypothetical protein